jgi:beta-glucanase (GH16 family)
MLHAQAIANGTYTLTPQNATGLRLDDEGARTTTGNGIDVYTENGTGAQNWALSDTGVTPAGYYNLSTEGAYCLTASGTTSRSAVVLDPCAGTSAQAWEAVASGSNYVFHPANNTALCLTASGTTSGNAVDVDTCSGATSQEWSGPTAGGSGGGGGTGTCSGVSDITIGSTTYTPSWCQEFNGAAGPPSTIAWNFNLGNNGGWGNNEVEVYCGPPGYSGNPSECPTSFSTSTAPVYIDGAGHLVIYVRDVAGTWISARMTTEGIQNFKYGILEASIQAPSTASQGLWPAFWTLGSDINTDPWPDCGEADIMELWASSLDGGAGTTGNHSTIHTEKTGGNGVGKAYTLPNGEQNDNAFHTYGIVWSENKMEFFVDNPSSPFFTVTPSSLPSGDTWPFNADLFTILNVAVGGTLGGSTSGLKPTPMYVDYVRWYAAP